MRVTLDELEVTYLESELGWGYRIPVTPYLGDDNIPKVYPCYGCMQALPLDQFPFADDTAMYIRGEAEWAPFVLCGPGRSERRCKACDGMEGGTCSRTFGHTAEERNAYLARMSHLQLRWRWFDLAAAITMESSDSNVVRVRLTHKTKRQSDGHRSEGKKAFPSVPPLWSALGLLYPATLSTLVLGHKILFVISPFGK
jgi:hypothetical protein